MKRREGLAKLTGREPFVDDLLVPGCIWGMTVRSPSPRGRIREIRFGSGVNWSEFVVVDHRSIPGPNVVTLIEDDQPILAAEEVRHLHEPVVLIAHPSREKLRIAARQIEIVVDPLPPVLDFLATPAPDQIQYGSDNHFKNLTIQKGDIDAALAAAPHVIEGEYRTGAQEHVYLEPQGMAAWIDGSQLVVKGSMQCPFYVQKALCRALELEDDGLRVVQTPTGGGFGGKEEYPSILALHVALLARAAERPVKMIYDRSEDMAATTKRHPSWVRHRTGVDHDGRLLAQEIEVVLDAGAYVTLSPVVLSRAVIHAGGPYACENVRILGRAMLSNAVPFGAFRGFGAPQTLFALERHMDVIARRLGIDPIEIRRRNLIEDGQSTATGQTITDRTDRQAVLDRALEDSQFQARREEHRRFNQSQPLKRRGIGVATFHHGAGFTGSGEVALHSLVHVAGLPDGRVEVLSSSVEMGQGTQTIFTQLATERLGLAPEDVLIADPDTSRVPDSGPTVASRTAMVVGRLVEKACDDLRQQLGLDHSTTGDALRKALVDWHRAHPGEPILGSGHYQAPPGIVWDDEAYRGDAYGAFAWAAYIAEVEIDLRTFEIRVLDFVAVQEVGKVLNEVLARGQIQGGVVQGIGWALLEECRFEDGGMRNAQLTNYIIPTSSDVPPIRVAFLENPYPHGAQGAKGLGELPMDGPAPAIFNAVAAALDVEPCELPLTPERLMDLVEQVEGRP